jgi:hypothetical protein
MTITTATQDVTTVTTFTMQAPDLHRILANVLPATSRDKTLPVLTAVQITIDDGTVLAVATDRYRLHSDTAPTHDDDKGVSTSFLLQRDNVTALVKLLKTCVGAVTITTTERTFACRAMGVTVTYDTLDGDFPRWRTLVPPADVDCKIDAPFSINPAFFADFAKVQSSEMHYGRRSKTQGTSVTTMPTIKASSPVKPFRVEIGPTFVGLIMPVRLA